MTKQMDFEAFMEKALKRNEEINKVYEIEVKGYGIMNFNKPKHLQLLKYIDKSGNAVEFENKENGEIKVISQDLFLIDEASRELVYFTCPFLQDKKLQEALGIIDPLQTPIEVFGIEETMDLAGKISKLAKGESLQEEVNEKIKN